LNMCYLSLTQCHNDDILSRMLNSVPPQSVVLIEDIDAIFEGREVAIGTRCNVSFSGFLNALDGVKTMDGRILIMTTNHKDKLDPALLRPGRAD